MSHILDARQGGGNPAAGHVRTPNSTPLGPDPATLKRAFARLVDSLDRGDIRAASAARRVLHAAGFVIVPPPTWGGGGGR